MRYLVFHLELYRSSHTCNPPYTTIIRVWSPDQQPYSGIYVTRIRYLCKFPYTGVYIPDSILIILDCANVTYVNTINSISFMTR